VRTPVVYRLNQRTFGQQVRHRFQVVEGRNTTYVGVGLLDARTLV
jgi:hypothetical protein